MRSKGPMGAIGRNVIIRPNCEAFRGDGNDLDAVTWILRHMPGFERPCEETSQGLNEHSAAAGVATRASRPAAMSPCFQSRSFESPRFFSMLRKILMRWRCVAALRASQACDLR